MKIGFDSKRIFFNRSGLGNYGRNILSYMQDFYPENEYFLFSPKKEEKIEISLRNNTKIIEPQNLNFIKSNSYWRTKGVLKENSFTNLDVFHGLSNELPVGISKTNVKSILTVHDLIFVRFPELYKPIDRKIYLWKMKKSCAEADKIIAISRQTKNDLIAYLNVDTKKIEIVYQGCNEIYFHKKTEEQKQTIREKYGLPKNFILNVGTIEPRKNALLVVQALQKAKIDFPLVIVGKERPYTEKIRKFTAENKMENQVFIINNVDFKDLPTLYQSAEIFVYPSKFEGFGIPIIEAFNSEVPIITSDIDVFKEVANDAALLFKNENIDSLAEMLKTLLNDKALQTKLINAGKKRSEFFSGENVAKDLMRIYKTVKK
ncbi:MAG: glycosyltransferase family 4 protein [Bacteroidales bacterium]|nr:glycosyltransferase family 4 protein [Bacteroidales bacterium]